MTRPSSPRSVLFADNSFTFGGAINALADLVGALDVAAYQAVVVSKQETSVLERCFPHAATQHWDVELSWVEGLAGSSPDAQHGRLGGRRVREKVRALHWLLTRDLPASLRFARLARPHGPDLVHLNNGVEGMLPALLGAKLLGLPVVAHSRGPQGTSGIVRWYARLPDYWIAVSQCMAANLRELGVDPRRIAVIHDSVDPRAFSDGPPASSLRGELGIPGDAPLFGVFGRILPWKGVREFVLAARSVLTALPGAHALVVGDRSDGSEEYYADVLRLSEQLGIADRLRFTGYRPDVPDVMRACDVVVHTSIVPEPFGLTVLEAMATGTPVVAANSGGPTEIVLDGCTGLLVDPMDTEALAAAILRLLREPETRAAMGRAGARRARAEFSPAGQARSVEALYDSILDGQAPVRA